MSFASDLDRIVNKTQANIETVIRKVCIDSATSAVKKTPVATGRARGNWQASVDGYESSYDESASDPTGTAAINEAVKEAASVKIGKVFYFVNSLPYIRQLEYGSSKQAPQGMVRITAAEQGRILAKALRAIR